MTFKFRTAGESHGKGVLALIEGVPAGIAVDEDSINRELARRQGGCGRSGRQAIERDTVEILTGVRKGETIGSPVTLLVKNRDVRIEEIGPLTNLRPGHADVPGAIKYNTRDARNVSERASARETAARVAAGAFCRLMLREFDIDAFGFVTEIHGIVAENFTIDVKKAKKIRDKSLFYSLDPEADEKWKKAVYDAEKTGDTLGGRCTVRARCPAGLGSVMQWDGRLDSRLAGALMSIPSVKGVEIGDAFACAGLCGSEAVDEVAENGVKRKTNRAGGIEGGMTNGGEIVVRLAVKPVPTIGKGAERHDTCVVPSVSVIAESMVLIVLSGVLTGEFCGSTLEEMLFVYKGWRERRKGLPGI